MTSSILAPRRVFGLCSPRAQRMASPTLDLPQPLGPTMQVTPGKTFTSVFSANDLKPWIRIDSSRIGWPRPRRAWFIDNTRPGDQPRKKPHEWGPGGSPRTRCWREPSGGKGAASGPFQQAALLVLLARAARAQIVAPDLLAVQRARLAAARGGPRGGAALARLVAARLAPLGRALGDSGGGRLLLGHAHLEELLDRRLLQAADHLLEHVEGFLLVLGQRVALAVAAEPDALLQVIHVQQVLAPELVDAAEASPVPLEPEDDPALEPVEHLGAHLLLALAIVTLGRPGDLLHQGRLSPHLLEMRGRHPEVELAVQGLVEPDQVPVLGMGVGGRVALHQAAGQLADPLEHGLLLALPRQDLTPQPVDDLALLVHHVVVLEQVLADLEVARLDPLLGGADGAGDELVLHRLALLHAQAVHDPLDPLGAEDA